MKLYFMKKEALDILKDNIDLVYNKYFTEKDNKWIWTICGGDPFIEYKEVPDFQLSDLDSDMSIGDIEFNNCKILYKNLSFLNESQASDERLWAGLCHSVFYNYVRRRWDYHSKQPKTQKEAVSNIKSRFFFSGGTRAGLYRNTLAKCWWVGRNTSDGTSTNPFEKLDIIGSNNISSKISDIFYSNNFSSNPTILGGIVNGIKYFKDEGIQITLTEHVRPSLQLLNAVGGGLILDCLSEEDIAEIMIENIYAIIQGDEQGIVAENSYDENDYGAIKNSDSADEDEMYIALGNRVTVFIPQTNETKIINADYLPGRNEFPPLVKILLGKGIEDEVEFQGKTYQIKEIH
ncbi:DUF6339 family protein [Clostridium algidicarnis]|uniref:Uncharacterized protein n=1 Tax=Clostridium algidicarnis DSM 15099 TaxID=1121295 RepID=A0A2S6FUQ4_9CLOT|nr:DUF6339 family protein [Clostridium algidicarnis]PPK44159.1 hypothetical protein BD821_12426 [Clostridium algidicarnis DSM 15099]